MSDLSLLPYGSWLKAPKVGRGGSRLSDCGADQNGKRAGVASPRENGGVGKRKVSSGLEDKEKVAVTNKRIMLGEVTNLAISVEVTEQTCRTL